MIDWREGHRHGLTLAKSGRLEEAQSVLERIHRLQPFDISVLYDLGAVLKARGRFFEALDVCERILVLSPTEFRALGHRGNLLCMLSRVDEARKSYEEAISIEPRYVPAYSDLLLSLNYVDIDPAAGAEMHRFLGARLASLFPEHATAFGKRPLRERIRLGYLSADFREHAVSFFLEPVLDHHDRSQFEIFLYSSQSIFDETTARFQARADCWRQVAHLDDEELCRRIRDDGIDLLIDMSGHTQGGRVVTLLRRAAPIQISWFGYLGTSGLPTVDYRITDPSLSPAGVDSLYSEKLIRLPRSLAFKGFPATPGVTPLPASSRAAFTFGSFNSGRKLTDRTLRIWARILRENRDSRLRMIAEGAGSYHRLLSDRLRDLGVSEGQLEIRGQLPLSDFLAQFDDVDLGLDPVPHAGGATTAHGLWMGTPSITLEGRRECERIGASILRQQGLDEFVAKNEEDYVWIASQAVREPLRLANLRDLLRQRRAPEGSAVTRHLEAALKEIHMRRIDLA